MGEKLERTALCNHVYTQRVRVAFEYVICFTHHVFERTNPTFVETVCRGEPERRHRLFFVIDDGVATAWPSLATQIKGYCDAHASHLELLEVPLVVAGGERAKQSAEIDSKRVVGTLQFLRARHDARGSKRASHESIAE